MANSFKDIIITPNVGQVGDPKIEFRGGDAVSNTTITALAYPTANGTLSFEGSAGQLFSITNSLTGTIYSVNDISGIPSIEVLDDGQVRLARFGGNVTVNNSLVITESTLLSSVLAIDGASSGIDADLLDGVQGSGYVNTAGNQTISGTKTFTAIGTFAISDVTPLKVERTGSSSNLNIQFTHTGATRYFGITSAGALSFGSSADLTSTGSMIWHAGNDGASSGLDADLLDGQQGSYYLSAPNLTGTIADARLPTSMTAKTFTGAVTLAADPSSALHAATKQYVDNLVQGISPKTSVHVATTANITLSGTQTIDGVAVIAGDRVLVKNQSTAAQNGIYLCAAGAWTRTADADAWLDMVSAYVFVEEGTTQADTGWTCTINMGGTLGTTAVTWVQFSGSATFTGSTGITKVGSDFQLTGQALAIHELATTGFVRRTGADTFTATSLTSGEVTTALGYTPWHVGNDGAASGLDADLLDGVQGSNYARLDSSTTQDFSGYAMYLENGRGISLGYSQNNYGGVGYNVNFTTTPSTWTAPLADTSSLISFNSGGMILYGAASGTAGRTLSYTNVLSVPLSGNMTYLGSTVWTASNDGAASGLDADLLDGQQGSYYLSAANLNAGILPDARLSGTYTGVNITGSAATLTTGRTLAITGDLAWTSPSFNGSGNVTAAGTLATVNSNVGSFGSSIQTASFTVNAKGLITAASNVTITPHWTNVTSKPTTLSGYGITDAMPISGGEFTGAISLLSTTPLLTFKESDRVDGTGYYRLASSGGVFSIRRNTSVTSDFGTEVNEISISSSGVSFNTTPTVGSSDIWHAGNDGAASGLDADLLDGQHGAYYLSASNLNAGTVPDARITGAYTGITSLSMTGALTVNGSLGTWSVDSQGAIMDFTRGSANYIRASNASGSLLFQTGGAGNTRLTIDNGGNSTFSGPVIATTFTGNGSALTALNATQLTTGTVPDARLAGVYSGVGIKLGVGYTVFSEPNTGSHSTIGRTVHNLVEYRNNTSAATGAIVFIAPNTTSTVMHRLNIEGMLYSAGPTINTVVQGYRTTGAWSSTSKVNLGITDVQVRLGVTPDGKNCVILGDVGTVWSYPHVGISKAMLSHNVADSYCYGWTTALVTDLSTYTNVTATIANTWGYDGTDLRVGGSKVWDESNDGSGSGLDADTLDGAHKDAAYNSFTAGAIPVRGTSGYLYTNYLNMTADTSTSMATKLVIETAGSGFLRWQTPDQFITNHGIWTSSNDGAASGLDADLLDGQQGSYYTDIPTRLGFTPVNRASVGDSWDTAPAYTTVIGNAGGHLGASTSFGLSIDYSTNYKLQLSARDGELYLRTMEAGVYGSWLRTWHSGNDGAASGLDADLLDGQQGSYYLSASNLNAGTLPDARLSGTYTGVNITGSAATLTTGRTLAITGDLAWTSPSFNGSGNVTAAGTLATVNANVGSFGSATAAPTFTVNAKGLITAAGSATITPAWSSITSKPTTMAGYGITDATGVTGLTGVQSLAAFKTGLALEMSDIPGAIYKKSVRAATTANITLSGTQTIDGIAVIAGDRVLVKNQTTASQNGIYVVAAGAWTRPAGADSSAEMGAAIVGIDSGTTLGGRLYSTRFKTTDTLGTTAMVWYEIVDTAGPVVFGGTISATNLSGTNTGDQTTITGNAGSATVLQTARTIGGVSFNGSANINLPGVNTAGNQNTTGSAATLTTGRTIAMTGDVTWNSGSFNGSANVTAAGTLATVNSNVGAFGSNAAVPVITVNAKGLVTAVSTAALGTAAVATIGTSGGAVPVCNTVNTWSKGQIMMSDTVSDTASSYALQVREVNGVGVAQSAASYAPSIVFHWSGRVIQRLMMDSTGLLKWDAGLSVAGDITAYSSDSRLKTNVNLITNPLDKLGSIGGYTFDWDRELTEKEGFTPYQYENEHGFLAQEIQKIVPDAVRPAPFNDKYLTVKYERVIPLVVAGVNELVAKNTALETRVSSLEAELAEIKAMMASLLKGNQ